MIGGNTLVAYNNYPGTAAVGAVFNVIQVAYCLRSPFYCIGLVGNKPATGFRVGQGNGRRNGEGAVAYRRMRRCAVIGYTNFS